MGSGEGRVQKFSMAQVSSTLPWNKYILCPGMATNKMEGLSCILCFDERIRANCSAFVS